MKTHVERVRWAFQQEKEKAFEGIEPGLLDKPIKFPPSRMKTELEGSEEAQKKELIADNPKTYTHFDMLATVARQTKHLFEENEALKESIKELLPIVQHVVNGLILYEHYTDHLVMKTILERAKKLIE